MPLAPRWLPVALLASVAGCSDPYAGQYAVSGTVTLAGEPLKDGSIQFVPVAAAGTQSGAPIAAGKYSFPKENGLKAGKYLVRITAGDGKTPADDESGGPGGSTNIVSVGMIPPEWNSASAQQVDVTEAGPNTFDFKIPNKYVPKKKK